MTYIRTRSKNPPASFFFSRTFLRLSRLRKYAYILEPSPSAYCVKLSVELRVPVGSPQDVYTCAICDEQIGGLSARTHIPQHTLVRCLSPAERSSEGPERVEERLRALEDKVASCSDRVGRMERLLEGTSKALSRLAPL